MTDLRDRLLEDLKNAMRARDEVTRDTLRMVKSELTLQEVEAGAPLEDAAVQEILLRARKTREESIAQYAEGGREDLAAKERAEVAVIERYLPKQLDEAETRSLLQSLVTELGLSSKRDMGKLMAALNAQHPGAVDKRLAAKLAGDFLSA